MTNSHELTRQRVFLETQLWKTAPESSSCKEDSALVGSLTASNSTRCSSLHKLLTENCKLHDTCLLWIVSFWLTLSPPSAVRNTKPVLCLQSPRDRAIPSAVFIYVESRSAPSLLHLSPLLQSLVLSSPTSSPTHTHTHTRAGARSITPGRAHAHCAHCSAAADVWWPQGTEPFEQIVIQIDTLIVL